MNSHQWAVALIGYGEVGRILAEDLRQQGLAVIAHDINIPSVEMAAHALSHGVALALSHADAVADADLVISAVTASQAVAVATACAAGMRDGVFFLDFNSASPMAKTQAAAVVDAAGARYVEGAVMTSVPPYRSKVPLLLGGPHAADLQPALNAIGFASNVASHEIGIASAIKMCRSVIIKGMEALLIESFTTARAYGVEDAVIASLAETFPGIDWDSQGSYFFQRVIEHGKRRAEEMREAARTVADAGLAPWLASAAAQRQGWVAALVEEGVFGQPGSDAFTRSVNWRIEADRLLQWP